MQLTERELTGLIRLRSKKGRRAAGMFLVEGIRCLAELVRSDYQIQKLIVCDDFLTGTGREFLRNHSHLQPLNLCARRFRRLAEETSSQGIIAVAYAQKHDPPDLTNRRLALVLERISDPSNLGAIIRSACAFDVPVFIGPDSAELYSPKVISASSGFIFRAVVSLCRTAMEAVDHLRGLEFAVWGGLPSGVSLAALPELPERLALVIGNETAGISEGLRQRLDRAISIPMRAGFDSLSAPVAGGIFLYALAERMKILD